MTKAHIVWNEGRTEGVVFKDLSDAVMTNEGYESMQEHLESGAAVTTLGESFTEMYAGDTFHLECVDVVDE